MTNDTQQHGGPAHYRKSPSAAARQMACPGSLTLPIVEQPESEYAAEGTKAHDLAAKCIANYAVLLTDDEAEMYDVLQPYVAHCIALKELAEDVDGVCGIEQKLESKEVPDHGGTLDFYVVVGQRASVVDLKYGQGVSVCAERNPQLLCYAALLLERHPEIETFDLTIVQPRTPGEAVDAWIVSADDVRAFRREYARRLGESEFVAGNHCRWCPAKLRCEHLREQTFGVLRQKVTEAEIDDLVALHEIAPAVKTLLDEAAKRLVDLRRKGHELPGWKVVTGRGSRKWAGGDANALALLLAAGVDEDDAIETRLRSPAQLEKIVGKKKIAHLIQSKPGGPTLAPAADPRDEHLFPVDLFPPVTPTESTN